MLRFAPSPTGDMQLGKLRVAIVNYLVAQQCNKPFTVRIEDRDETHNIEGKDTEIMQILEKFALQHQSVFHQSEHLHMYQTLAITLLEKGKAFVCSCTPEQIEAEKKAAKANNEIYHYSGTCYNIDRSEHLKLKENNIPFVIRIKKPEEDISYYDLIKRDIHTSSYNIDSFVILRSDGTPTYNFACACDDMISGVSYIIREEDHLLDTPKQKYIKEQLGYKEEIKYAHLPLILDAEGKQNKDISVKWLFEQGFLPDAILNYLLLMGNSKAPKEIFTLPEAITWFSLDDISPYAIQFDIDKLRSINREHLKMMDEKQLSTLFGFADADVGKLAKLYLVKVSTINELAAKIRPIFAPKLIEGKWKIEMKTIQELIIYAPMIESFDLFISYLTKESDIEEKDLLKPLRLLLTGADEGPELRDIYPLIKPYLLEVVSS